MLFSYDTNKFILYDHIFDHFLSKLYMYSPSLPFFLKSLLALMILFILSVFS